MLITSVEMIYNKLCQVFYRVNRFYTLGIPKNTPMNTGYLQQLKTTTITIVPHTHTASIVQSKKEGYGSILSLPIY